jgi:hypothetical protein
MRVLLTVLSLISGSPDDVTAEESQRARIERTDEYRAVLAEIATRKVSSMPPRSHDLPDAIREAIEAWTDD